MIVGSHSVNQGAGYAIFYSRDESGWALSQIEQAPDKGIGDDFGWSCAVDGTHAVIGRRGDGILNSQGSAYAYERQPDGHWAFTQKLTVPVGWWAFGWSMSFDGDRIAIAAKGAASLGNKGRVFIFEFENGQWVQKAMIAPSLDTLGDWFGASVALQGDRLAVGAPKSGTGRAYVFDRQGDGTWVEQALFTPPVVTPTGDEFGGAVSLYGDKLAVGAIGYDSPFVHGGAVFIYSLETGTWQLEQQVSVPPTATLPGFGKALALDQDELWVTSPSDATLFSSSGAAYRFEFAGGIWSKSAEFYGSEPFTDAQFGWSLSKDGDSLAISAQASNSPLPGKVHLFSIAGGAHLQGNTASISAASGGSQPLQLGACPEHGGDFYLILGSLSGTTPALPLGNEDLPLVFDSYTLYGLEFPNSPLLPASLGILDPAGRANAELRLPPGSVPNLIGQTAHHAFLILDSNTLAIEGASNPTPVLIAP